MVAPSVDVDSNGIKSLNNNLYALKSDMSGKLNIKSKSTLLFNLYLSCLESSADYRFELTFYLGFIEDIIDSVSHTDIVIEDIIDTVSHTDIVIEDIIDSVSTLILLFKETTTSQLISITLDLS